MRLNALKATWAIALGIFALSSCTKDNNEPTTSETNSNTITTISFESEFALDEENEELKAIDFTAGPNKKGHTHPSLTLELTKGKKLPITLIFRNENIKKLFAERSTQWTYDGKKLSVSELELPRATADLLTSTEGWHMLVMLGGELDKQGKLHFNATKRMALAQAGTISLETIYLAKSWTPLNLTKKVEKGVNVNTFSVKKAKDDPNLGRIVLKNQGMTVMTRLKNNDTNKKIQFYGMELSTSGLSFSGHYDLLNLPVNKMPQYTPDRKSNVANFIASIPVSMPAKSSDGTGYLYCVGIPTSATTNIRFTPYVDANLTRANHVDRTDLTIKSGGYAGMNNISLRSIEFSHPIEAFLTEANHTTLKTNSSSTINNALNSGASVQEANSYRIYGLPTIEQMAVLVPYLKGKDNIPSKVHPVLDFGRREQWDGSELIAAWSTSGQNYNASYRPGIGDVFYATRLHNGSPNGGEYYSAYRYERKGDQLEIRVRELKNTPGVHIAQISNENYWNSPTAWNQREHVRTILRGQYWSSSWARRGGPLGIKVYHSLKIFTTDDGITSKPNGAFVGGPGESKEIFGDNPNLPKNKTSKGTILVTTQGQIRSN